MPKPATNTPATNAAPGNPSAATDVPAKPLTPSLAAAQPRTTILTRRSLLRAATIGGLASALSRPLVALANDASTDQNTADQNAADEGSLPYMDRLGLQLYTVRDQLAKDADATLSAIFDAGYRQVELMSVDENALQLAAMARDKGLRVHSGFIDWNTIRRAAFEPESAAAANSASAAGAEGVLNVDQTVELGERLGLRHLVFGYIGKDSRQTADQCRRIAEAANRAAEKTRAAGMRMCYHNHSFEFAKLDGGERTAYDIFIEKFDPHQLDFELDVFWVKIGGQDPLELMRRLAGRITQVHLKDLKADAGVITDESNVPNEAFQEIGDGIIDIPAVMRLAKEMGVQECHVEQDQSPAPLESVAQSFRYLQEKNT